MRQQTDSIDRAGCVEEGRVDSLGWRRGARGLHSLAVLPASPGKGRLQTLEHQRKCLTGFHIFSGLPIRITVFFVLKNW